MLLKSKPRNSQPGDHARILLNDTTDTQKTVWEAGTVYFPLSGGASGIGSNYQIVQIHGIERRFEWNQKK